ncbi:MAG TPA: FAD-dependent oxidoreductase [Solirubrobacterales bacterium]
MTESHGARKHVVIAGGGVAGLEATLALSALAKDLVDVELLTPGNQFVYRPLQVAEPFGVADQLRLDLTSVAADAGARHTVDALASVDPATRTVTTAAGGTIGYDSLLVAPGAKPIEAVPGALTFSGETERRRFGQVLGEMGQGHVRRVAFVVPLQTTWSIAAYELALLTAAERDARRLPNLEILLVTHESAPLDVFGALTSDLLEARLEEAGILLQTSSVADRVEDHRLHLTGADPLDADYVIALPALEVPPIAGLPQRTGGFVQTDTGMRVAGLESVWAAGDVTWFPVKQGGLAAQQAGVAARSIAAAAGAHVPVEPFQPVLRATLITGGTLEFFRSTLPSRGPGEASTGRELWWPQAKIAAHFLGPYLAKALGDASTRELVDLHPSGEPASATDDHSLGVELVLAAADADARAGDFAGALGWLALVERVNLVVPASYVARRDDWRRRLGLSAEPSVAAGRMDPSVISVSAAISDLQRRVGWLRELEGRIEHEMSDHLSKLDQAMAQLKTLSERAGILKSSPRS